MAIISKIGRRSLTTRLLIFTIYAALMAGSVTMLYPFGLMISGSTKSAVDDSEMRLIPRFLTSDEILWAKHVEGLFNESLEMMRQTYDSEENTFKKVKPPAEPNQLLAKQWQTFTEEASLPHYTYTIGYLSAIVSRGVTPKATRQFRKELDLKFDGDINRLNQAMGMEFENWGTFLVRRERYLSRTFKPAGTPLALALRDFKAREPIGNRYYFSPEGFYKHYLKTQYKGTDSTESNIVEYNRKHQTAYNSYKQIHLDRRLPSGPGRTETEGKDWEEFIRMLLNPLWIRADEGAAPAYRRLLKAKYGDINGLNRNYGTDYASFDQVPLISEPPDKGLALSDWDTFIQGWKDPDTGQMHILPVDKIHIHSVDFIFRDYLRERYGSIEKLNAALGTSFRNWLDILPPQRDAHYIAFRDKIGSIRWEFIARNYITVVDDIVLHGRGLLNTTIYCVLAVLGALIVNPLAAYALSRYKLPSAYKLLLFLMLTMSFPPIVTQIPSFLMLREFNMLNTFFALILPGLANGYSIFLLKGFFDSLPRELYESASLDGAGEFRLFWQITMSLSKPILAVIALSAFNLAYSNFMFALLTCQDKKMWTLMVWMYQLQQRGGSGVIFASLIIAAIPTFMVFALCQKIIMRGIVVPVEK